MSDTSKCEVCGQTGLRRRFKHCPDGWFYGEMVAEDDNDSVYVLVVCSVECREAFWKAGPGDLCTGKQDEEGKTLPEGLGVKCE